jgi:hypothetical protein
MSTKHKALETILLGGSWGSRHLAASRPAALKDVTQDAIQDKSDSGRRLTNKLRVWIKRYAIVIGAYLLATWFTNAFYSGDTPDYAYSILGMTIINDFWEFGHLLWRPLGWLLSTALRPVTQLIVGPNDVANVVFVLMAINWVAGLASALLLRAIVGIVTKPDWAANLITVAFICSNSVLNFAQTGSSYIPGLSLLLLGIYFLLADQGHPKHHRRSALLSGLSLGGAVCFWVPYVFVIPAVLAMPLLLFDTNGHRRKLVVGTGLAFCCAVALAYTVIILHLGIRNLTDLRAWIAISHHEMEVMGFSRVILGIPRSFINMGNDGMLFKRFLMNDPFAPVSVFDLVQLGLWKFMAFYLFLSSLVVSLLLSARGRQFLWFLVLSFVPLLVLATLFDGGATERYLPLYPALFLALAYSLSNRSRLLLKSISAAFVVAAMIVNLNAMSTFALNRQQESSIARIKDLHPLLSRESRVVLPSWQDDLINFKRNFPFNPINLDGNFWYYSLIVHGTAQTSRWREDFASQVANIWSRGGEVWVSKRVFSPRPLPAWNWVEGADSRVSWSDIHTFFSEFDVGHPVGDEDGFVLLMHSSKNLLFLDKYAKADVGSNIAGNKSD